MRFALYRKERSKEAQLEAQARVERLLAQGFRSLGALFTRAAELIEAQRLQRQGYDRQGRYLERLEKKAPSDAES